VDLQLRGIFDHGESSRELAIGWTTWYRCAMSASTTSEASWKRDGYNVAAMRELARRALPKPIFDFADGGAEEERTLRRNEAAFADWAFVPRPLDGAATRDPSVELFGARLSMPVLVGPTGLAGLFCADGERASARAAAHAGTAYCLSHGSVCTLEALAELGTSPRWMQVFVYKDRVFTRELIARAQAAGYHGLVLTIDNQLMGNRERDVRNHFGIPPRFTTGQLLGMTRQLPWLWSMRHALRGLTLGNYVRPGSNLDFASLAGRLASLLDPALSWDDVRAIRDQWKGPFLLKGVLHPDEAVQILLKRVPALDPEVAKQSVADLNRDKVWGVNGGLEREVTDFTIKFTLDAKMMPNSVSYDQVVDSSLVDAALVRTGKR